MLELNGSHLEGGGQILRTALGLSALTGQAFRIFDVRKGRCEPGVKPQHLCCITALKKICSAKVQGDTIGSESLEFYPNKIKSGSYEFDIGTAGSITLTLQSLLTPLMFCGKRTIIKIRGGTDVRWSQPIDYFTEVLMPHLQKYCGIECNVFKRGYYPKGGGEVEVKFRPRFNVYDYENFDSFVKAVSERTPKIDLLEQGHLLLIKGASHASEDLQKARVAERQADSARQVLKQPNLKQLKHDMARDIKCDINKCDIDIRREYSKALSTGSAITLWAIFSKNKEERDFNNPIVLGADALGERGKPAEEVGSMAAKMLLEQINLGAPVDEHLADNLLPFLIFGGRLKAAKITDHALTNIHIVEKFVNARFEVDKERKTISLR